MKQSVIGIGYILMMFAMAGTSVLASEMDSPIAVEKDVQETAPIPDIPHLLFWFQE